MDETYVTAAWSLFTFIVGCGTGGYLVRKLSGLASGPSTPRLTRPGFEWARRDIHVPEPTAANTMVRNVSGWQDEGAIDLDGRMLTFHLQDERTGLDRDVTLSAHQVMTFFKCDSPARSEWHGDVKVYTLALAIGKAYRWLARREAGNGYEWAIPFATRERRLRRISAWMNR